MKGVPKNLVFCFLSILLFCSCRKDKPGKKGGYLTHIQSNAIIIPLDSLSEHSSRFLFYFMDQEKEYLSIYHEKSNRISFYDLETKKKRKDVMLSKVGPNAIPLPILGYYTLNLNSIIVFGPNKVLYDVDSLARISRQNNYHQLEPEGLPAVSMSRYYSQAIHYDGAIYARQVDGKQHYAANNPTSYRLCYRFNLEKNEGELMDIHPPSSFWEDEKRELLFSWTHNGTDFIYSSVRDHAIFTSRDNQKIDQVKTPESNYIKRFFSYDNSVSQPSQNAYTSEYLQHQQYLGILYDPYRNLYYRFFWPGLSEDQIANLNDAERMAAFSDLPRLGICILNEDLDLIYAEILPDNTYLAFQSFVGKEGLYLCSSHPGNPKLKENQLTFDLYSFQPN